MQTAYVGPMHADLNDQSRTAKLELRAEPSEHLDGHLGLSVNGYTSGKELVLLHLSPEQVAQLAAALDTFLKEA